MLKTLGGFKFLPNISFTVFGRFFCFVLVGLLVVVVVAEFLPPPDVFFGRNLLSLTLSLSAALCFTPAPPGGELLFFDEKAGLLGLLG